MEEKETRLLEEWKVNNDLFKFHEDLKQKRFAHFVTIQAAFLAIFGLLAKEAIPDPSIVRLLSLVLVSALPAVIAIIFIQVDKRARAYIVTVKAKLLLIEEEWQRVSPDNHFATYSEQFAVLVRRKPDTIVDQYVNVLNLPDNSYKELIHTGAAHDAEEWVLRLFRGIWICLAFSAFAAVFLVLLNVGLERPRFER